MLVNKADWIAFAGWSLRYFDKALGEGFPVKSRPKSRGDDWRIDTAAGIAWIVERRLKAAGLEPSNTPDLNVERARLFKEQADKAELENARLRGELVSRAKVEAGLAVMDLALKDRLMTVPMAAAPEAIAAAAMGGLAAAAEVIAAHINSALSDVASAEVVARA